MKVPPEWSAGGGSAAIKRESQKPTWPRNAVLLHYCCCCSCCCSCHRPHALSAAAAATASPCQLLLPPQPRLVSCHPDQEPCSSTPFAQLQLPAHCSQALAGFCHSVFTVCVMPGPAMLSFMRPKYVRTVAPSTAERTGTAAHGRQKTESWQDSFSGQLSDPGS